MKYLMLITCLVFAILAACDNRNGEKTELMVIPLSQTLYNVANHDTVSIICQLTGSESQISNQIIDVVYDEENGLFIGSGSDNYLITDEEGYAKGLFKVDDGYYGEITMQFTPEHYNSEAKTITLHVLDMPKITVFTAEDSTLTAEDPAYTNIAVQITSHSNNIANQTVRFALIHGVLESVNLQTDSSGIATNVFHRNSYTGDVVISAYLDMYPEDVHNLTVHCQ